jgi:pyrroloquinoline quinone (PQQ) biosynthesis protein C
MKSRSPLRSVVEDVVNESLQRLENHPFVVRANARKLSRNELERWIKCAGHESQLFPRILKNMIGLCQNPRLKRVLADNLYDECGNGDPERAHFNLYLQLLDELGVPRDDFYNYTERAGVRFVCELAESISLQSNLGIAIGYMLLNEGTPKITFSAVQHALLGICPELRTQFFQLHIDTDEKHVDDLYSVIDELYPTEEKDILLGISIGERGTAILLDEAYGLFDYCRPLDKCLQRPDDSTVPSR